MWSGEELSYPESLSSTSETESSTSVQVSFRECCIARFRPVCQIRRFKSKGASLVVVWLFLQYCMYNIIMHIASKQSNSWFYDMILPAIALTIPIGGALADVRFGRYKIISCGLWVMWISSILLTASLVVEEFENNTKYTKILTVLLIVITGVGWAGFQANIFQFGIDQLIDASSVEYKSFIVWNVFAFMASSMIAHYMLECVEYTLVFLLVASCNLTLALVLKFLFSHILIKEPTTQNPFKLVYKVIRYAIKHRRPRQRSAFTYCEDEIPSRIDFGKSKYGGPFTTEEVEDVKTLFRTLVVIVIGCAAYCASEERHFVHSRINDVIFRHHSSHQPLGKCSSEFIIRGFYFISGTLFIPLHELLLYPLFNRLIPTIKSYYKIVIGVSLHVIRHLILLTMATYSRHSYLETIRVSTNTTVLCLLEQPSGFISDYVDYRWIVIPEFLYAVADVLIFIGILEFLCSQVPYSMKGLVVGATIFLVGLYQALIYFASQKIFENEVLPWGTGIISCGFWYFIFRIILQVLALFIFVVIIKCYKRRKREDILPNDHIFAERYYSQSN